MNFTQLITDLRDLDGSLKSHVKQSANIGLTLRNWFVGAYIVEFEQNGEERAEYGSKLIKVLAESISIKGLNARTLADCRLLHLEYSLILQTASAKSNPPQILQTVTAIFENLHKVRNLAIPQTLSAESQNHLSSRDLKTPQTPSGELKTDIPQALSVEFNTEEALHPEKGQTVSDFSERPDFAIPVEELLQKISFSHFVELLRLDDPLQRAFYEIECIKSGWSVRELKRQIGSLLYERLGLSTDKEKLLRLTSEETKDTLPADLIKDPYIFEFLGLTPKEAFREKDLETALLDNLQDFLLELGAGFCFEDRQKKISIGASDYFVDLVFYHRKLHCHVIIELKVEPFTHNNAGQLNTYLSYYKKHEMAEGDNPPIGLLLCTDKDHTLVEYALGGMDENLFVSNYKVALPKRSEIEAFLREQTT